MIISASYRTDIPAFYAPWFLNRLRAGSVEVRNPYGGRPSRIDLRPGAVDGFVFWTRNIGPLAPHLAEVRAVAPFVVQLTITGYPSALDRSVIAPEKAVEQLHRLAADHGSRVAVWRYDPIVFSSLTPPAWHVETFGRLAEALRGAVDEVVVSFAQIYRKTQRNLDRAAAAECFTWNNPPDDDKEALLSALAPIARANGQRLTLCAQAPLLVPGVEEAACIDVARLTAVAGHPVAGAAKPHRKTCRCAASRDIGGYDTCPHGCVYCYAVQNRDRAKEAYQNHDPVAERL